MEKSTNIESISYCCDDDNIEKFLDLLPEYQGLTFIISLREIMTSETKIEHRRGGWIFNSNREGGKIRVWATLREEG